MGNLKAFIPIALSLILALGGSYLLYKWVKEKTAPDKVVLVKESRAMPVVVAKINIPWGSRLNIEMLETKSFLEGSVPAGYFSSPETLAGRVLVSPLIAGEPVLEAKLAPTSLKSGGISAVLNSGTRAISVKGNPVLGLAGLINPGNRVDVLVTMDVLVTTNDPKSKEKRSSITKIVVENLLVLATGTQIVENSEGKTSPVDVFTLEVTPDQGERLTLAADKGQLQFALRGATDTDIVLTKGATISELLAAHHLEDEKTPSLPVRVTKARVVKKRAVSRRRKPRSQNESLIIIRGLSVQKQ